MILSVDALRETLDVNRDELRDNRMLTNELLIDDIMIDLGYNKKRDKNVKRIYSSELDWEVQKEDKIILGVRVFPTDSEISGDEVEKAESYAKSNGIINLIITDGNVLEIKVLSLDSSEYISLTKFSISNSIDEDTEQILQSLTKDSLYSDAYCLAKTVKAPVSIDSVKNAVLNNIDAVAGLVSKALDCSDIKQCKDCLVQLLSSQVVADEQTLTSEYKEKLSKAYGEVDTLKAEVDNLKAEITELQNQLEASKVSAADKARELLSLIEDSDTLDRSYVAVINTELCQYEDLHTFIGRALQKLYEIKNLEALQHIFNGDIFKLVQPAVRHDLLIGDKAYDIELNDENEDDALNKLRVIFSHFDDVIFLCKKIGVLKETASDTLELPEDLQDDNEENEANASDNEINLDGLDIDDIEFGGDTQEESNVQNSNSDESFIVCQLLSIDELIWGQEEVELDNIKYIGNNNVTYNINMNKAPMSYEQMLCKCVDAILALEAENNVDIIAVLKHQDLSNINNYIKLYTQENAGYPRITSTQYAVVGVDSAKLVLSILCDICNALNIDLSDKFVYFNIRTESESIINDYSFSEDVIQLREYTNIGEIQDTHSIAVLKGDMFNKIVMTQSSLQEHSSVLESILAIKTRYLATLINGYDNIVEVIEQMASEANKQGIEVKPEQLGCLIGTEYKVIDTNESAVGPEATRIFFNKEECYLAKMEAWQAVHVLIKLHSLIFADTAIAIKCGVNTSVLDFYSSEFRTAEPTASLAVKTFTNYLISCIKN